MARTSARALALEPLSHADAERLLPTLSQRVRLSEEERLLRARCLRVLESFHAAWDELVAFHAATRDAPLRGRATIDLLYLGYFLARPGDVLPLVERIGDVFAGHPLLAAELHLGQSVLYTGADQLADAFREAQFARDALRVSPAGTPRDLVEAALDRQLAHLYAHSASYGEATQAAAACEEVARRIADPWELHRATYTRGYVAWQSGRLEEARSFLDDAESALRESRASLWRWTSFCVATVEAELGLTGRAQLAQQSGYGTPEGLAYLALLRGEVAVAAELVLGKDVEGPRAIAVAGLVRCRRGDERSGVRDLDAARVAFERRGLLHCALSCAIHDGYWRDRIARGSGAHRAVQAFREIASNDGEGFEWYDPSTARWLASVMPKEQQTAKAVQRLAERAERVLRQRPPELADEATLDAAVPYLRSRGLTAREISILRAMEELEARGDQDRAALADRLRMSENTLRVHLTRIRSKLNVGEKRGYRAVLEAALRRR